MSNVDRNSPIPLYYQIAMDLRTRVKWEWGYGAKLPNEPDLAEEYGTSRMTVRQAMAELVTDGTLIRKRAKGTFVREEPASFVHTLTLPFRSRLQTQGIELTSKILKAEVQKAESKEISKYLEISPDTNIAYFKRLFMVPSQPVAINQSMIPERHCPGITSSPLIDDSISNTLSQRYGVKPITADDWLEAVLATEKDASLLNTFPGAPLLLVMTLSRTSNNEPLEFSRTLWNTERMRLHVQLNTPSNTTNS